MSMKSTCAIILFIILCSACSEEPNQSSQKNNNKAKPDTASSTKASDSNKDNKKILDNISLEELINTKLSSCVLACEDQTKICLSNCRYLCRKQCTNKDCISTDPEKNNKCKQDCSDRCDEDNKCKSECSYTKKSCINTCPNIH